MVRTSSRRVARPFILASALTLTLTLATASVPLCASAAVAPPPAHWFSANVRARAATLTLIAGYTDALGGFNFDGYGKGAMVVSVPSGYRVTILYHNKGAYPHSVLVTPYARKDLVEGWPVAFRGAASSDATNGASPGAMQRFSFVADRVGTYAIICAVAGHEQAGMWDVLGVTRGGKPSITIVTGRH